MSQATFARALKLRAVALEFRSIALRSTDAALSTRMREAASELELIAESLSSPGEPGDVVWADGPSLETGSEP